MKKIILGIVILLIVIVLGGNYYTGSKIEKVIPQQLSLLEQNINNSLQDGTANDVSVKLIPKLHKEFFKSTGEIEAILLQNGKEVNKLVFDADIYNGPFPLNKLKFLNFAPKMFSGVLSLDKNKNPLIEAKEQVPVTAVSTYSYSDDLDVAITGTPLKMMAVSILNDWDVDLSQNDKEKTAEIKMGDIVLDNLMAKIELKDFNLDSVFNSTTQNQSILKIDQAIFSSKDTSKFVINDLDFKHNITNDNKADVRMNAIIKMGSFEATNSFNKELKVWDDINFKFNIPYINNTNIEANINKYLDRDIIIDKFKINNGKDKIDTSLKLNISSNYKKNIQKLRISKVFNKLELNLDFTQNMLVKLINANQFIDGNNVYIDEDTLNQGISYLISNNILVKKGDGDLESHIKAKEDGFDLNGKDISNFELLKYVPMY